MKKHLKHDLWLHDDRELSRLLENRISQRETLHEWPNSCVQKVLLKDGRTYIYKYQSGGSVEPSFYEKAKSPILPEARTLWEESGYSCMVLEYLDAPVLGQADLAEAELLEISKKLLESIETIEGDVPVLLDVSSYDKWIALARDTLPVLKRLVHKKRQYGSGMKDIELLEERILSPNLKSCYRGKTGLVHGDLNGGNIFPVSGGYKIIDWQSCKRAPIELDRASFLSRQGVSPEKHVGPDAALMLFFLGIWWLVQCQTRLIPDGNYDQGISYFIDRIKELDRI